MSDKERIEKLMSVLLLLSEAMKNLAGMARLARGPEQQKLLIDSIELGKSTIDLVINDNLEAIDLNL